MGNHLSVEISDNGQPFHLKFSGLRIESPHDTCRKRRKRHRAYGHLETQEKYRASLVITEYVPGTYSYTKQISLIFDAKKHYIIQTYRRRELGQIRFRDDLYIFPC